MITSLSNNKNISFKGVAVKFHLSAKELDSLRREKAANATLFKQGGASDCFFISALKSTMSGLNEYANKTGKQEFNARNWLKKLVVFDKSGDAEISFPLKNTPNKVKASKEPVFNIIFGMIKVGLSEGNKRVSSLEKAYGILSKSIDSSKAKVGSICQAINQGFDFLAMRDITGLKSIKLIQNPCETDKKNELYRKYTSKLFKKFKEHPENLVITIDSKENASPYAKEIHAFSLKKVVDDGLIIIDSYSKTNEEIKISFDDFYKYFISVDFARLRPEKMFKMLDEAKKTTMKVLDSTIFSQTSFNPIRNSNKEIISKNGMYLNVIDNQK